MFSISILSVNQKIEPLLKQLENNSSQVSSFQTVQSLSDEVIKNTELLILPFELDEQKILSLCGEFRHINPLLLFIILVDETKAIQSIEAFKMGAFDVLTLPLNVTQVKDTLRRIQDYIKHRNYILTQHLTFEPMAASPVAISRSMIHMIQLLHQVCDKDVPVLFIGETGTGKNVLASYLHAISQRKNAHFLTVNCGAISPSLLESELFGHEKGSFTGAFSKKIGLLEAANGGSLFLDEINSASPELQVRLLQFIQDKKLLRVGARTEVEVDVQLIFATNQPLRELVDKGLFREDLYFRLNVFPISIPPLRERTEDISHLAARFLFKHAPKIGKTVNSCGPGVLEALQQYAWPGNVRELENVILRALLLSNNDRIDLKDLPPEIIAKIEPIRHQLQACHPILPEDASLKEIELFWIKKTLKKYQGNKLKTAKTLGINPVTLWRKLEKETPPFK